LYEVDVEALSVSPFGDHPDGWWGTEAMTALGDNLYIVQGGTLWRVTTAGRVSPFSTYPEGWAGTEAMTARDGFVYAMQGGTLWAVNVANGGVVPLPGVWGGTTGMVAM
jgi:hypothetical protein